MFRLGVSVIVDVDKHKESVESVISGIDVQDVKIGCVYEDPSEDVFYYKNIGIRITDNASNISSGDTEFLFNILISNDIPANINQISAVISPDSSDEYYSMQLAKTIEGIIYTYLYNLTSSLLETTTNSTPDLMWYKALDGVHFYVNDAFCYTVSKTKDDVEDRKHAYIWNVSEDEALACQESEEVTLKEDKTCSFEELVNTPDGIKTMVTYKTPLRTKKGTLIGTAGIATDVTKQREYEAKLQQMAMTDSLSGLYNRRKLYDEATSRYPNAKIVVYMDIDYFKEINDTYGHEKGDAILKLVSGEIKDKFDDGITARMGGDEFVVVLGAEHTVAEINERIVDMHTEFGKSDDAKDVEVQLSVGIYSGDLPIEQAIKESDELMYEDKKKHHEG